ncbi:MAG: DUF4301 family protein [Psychroflexus maritimus]
MNYSNLPKGLLKFHTYPDGSRTAFEEHLVEADHYLSDQQNTCMPIQSVLVKSIRFSMRLSPS